MKPGPESESPPGLDRSLEIASVLFADIVRYSVQTIDRQSELLTGLQQVVKSSAEFQRARERDGVITLPTGDGMALVFFGDPVAAVRCALQIAAALRSRPEIPVRMGVHSGPVWRHADIKDELNVVGGGINMAQRVMDCGDAGHILLSANVAEVLVQLDGWRDSVHDLGVFEVKHSARVHLYNLYQKDAGNPAPPRKQPAADKGQHALPWRKFVWFALAGLLLAGAALLLWQVLNPVRTLSYYVTVQKYRDGRPYEDPIRMSGARVFEAGYRIRLTFSSPEPGYLYILNEGPESRPGAPVFNTLFPSPLNNGGSALLAAGSELQIPQGGPMIFDSEKGVEKLWLVWSKESRPELEALKRWLNPQDHGAIGDHAQLQAIEMFVSKFGGQKAETAEDDARRCTVIKGRTDVLVSLLKLEHD